MQIRHVGGTGLQVSRLGLGTMTWGRDTDADDAARQLAAFRDAGGTLVDTGATYGDRVAEEILGALLAASDRTEVVISTKAGLGRHRGERIVDASRRSLLDTLDGSLRRLGVDHVDLWQAHAWDPQVPLEETLGALDTAVSSGRARYVGVSNYSGWQAATAATWQRGWPSRAPVASAQVEFSLLRRAADREVIPACAQHHLGVLAWSPLAGGVLTGKYRSGTPAGSRGASEYWGPRIDAYRDEWSGRIVDALVTAAEGLGATPATVALAWARDHPGVTSVLLGARTHQQLEQSLAAEHLALPASIRAALEDVSAPEP